MSILKNLINNLNGNDSSGASVKRPCSNCASSCAIMGDACAECQPLKEKLLDTLYNVEHLDAYYDRYEVVDGATETTGTTGCPACGAAVPAGASVCEYCGTQIGESSGKIRVRGASEIPNPIMEAQDIIFERREIEKKYAEQDSGLFAALQSLVSGDDDDFGDRMTEEEITATAAAYGVSVSSYLAGLDNGVYLTASAKALEERYGSSTSGLGITTGIGAAGLGAAGIASALGNRNRGGLLSNSRRNAPPPPPQNNRQTVGHMPQQGFGNGRSSGMQRNQPARPQGSVTPNRSGIGGAPNRGGMGGSPNRGGMGGSPNRGGMSGGPVRGGMSGGPGRGGHR